MEMKFARASANFSCQQQMFQFALHESEMRMKLHMDQLRYSKNVFVIIAYVLRWQNLA